MTPVQELRTQHDCIQSYLDLLRDGLLKGTRVGQHSEANDQDEEHDGQLEVGVERC